MADDPGPKLTLLQRREIEARIVGPLVRAMRDELGEEKTLALLRRVIGELARESGADLARGLGDASLAAFSSCLGLWSEDGALEIDLLARTDDRLEFNVTRCRYAEMYHALGLADLGPSLSCRRDFTLVEGFNPEIRLERTRTIMEGAPFCDFRFHAETPAPDADSRSRPSPDGEPA